ncbi:MAG: response regulator transcription factor [Oscillospiraceae bacterium]|jgi:DNA-binding response OmpR family regulator|nr:response regulator transcription factor [Oscillospiraceae bacterium]
MSAKILLVEDEEKLARFVELELGYEGYEVSKAFDGVTGGEMAASGGYDLILLDVMLPGRSGVEVLRRVRKVSSVPVIMLTARDAVTDKVSGLDLGADDYVTKPFAIEELLARIRAALRKARTQDTRCGETLTARGVSLDARGRFVAVNGAPVELTKREFDLLHYLLKNKGIVVTREALLENVWGYDFDGGTNAVDVYIRFLRGKIDETFGIKLIRTVRGVGYAIDDA